jgi:pseudouridylate synthase
VKSILDVGATLERLESLSVGLVGYRTDRFPGFYVRDSGHEVPWTVESPEAVARIMAARDDLGLRQALVVANPIAEQAQMPAQLHDATLGEALAALAESGIRGKDVTPFLLGYFHDHTGGASLDANIALVLGNAELAGQVARELAQILRPGDPKDP